MAQPLSRIKTAQKNLSAKTTARERDFIGTFYESSPAEDLAAMDVATLQRTAAKHWEMMHKRKPGKALIAVHNPAMEKGGWPLNRTVIDFVDDDMAFQINSIMAEVTRRGHVAHLLVHPLLYVARKGRKITAIHAEQIKNTTAQSHIHVELEHMLTPAQCAELKASLDQIASDVRYATGDWQTIRDRLQDCRVALGCAPDSYPADAVKEYQEFLDYLYNDNFTLLGYRAYRYRAQGGKVVAQAVKGSDLGLLRPEVETDIMPEGCETLPPNLARFHKGKSLLRVFKLHRKSTVHRNVPVDGVMVRQFDKSGKVIGEVVFVGLFTSVTYSRSIRDIPYLRRKAETVMGRAHFRHGSHGHKALSHILEKYPRDELFQIEADALYDYTLSILRLQERQRIALYTRVDAFDRHISCLVYVPRERYDTLLRRKMQKILEDSLGGICQDFYTTLDDSPLARVMYIVAMKRGRAPVFDRERVEERLQEAGRAWPEQLNEALRGQGGDETEIARLTEKYGNAFPSAYRERYEAKQSVHDIAQIEQTLKSGVISRELYRPGTEQGHQIRLKLFRTGAPVVLSDILPVLQNMGLRVIAEIPFEIQPEGTESVFVQDFQMEVAQGTGVSPVDVAAVGGIFEEALLRIMNGEAENDALNSLSVTAAMPWRDVVILRAYVRYMRQGKTVFSKSYIESALADNPEIAGLLVALFHARLTPGANNRKDNAIHKAIETALGGVSSLDQDRILRALSAMVLATLRTNFYQKGADGLPKAYISYKLDSAAVPEIPEPRPFREIWVYSPRMEGIHLRADRIARGGIRWSDRNEDFRTEILGLMKAQQVKNSIIVPMGSKGGFVLKAPPAEGGRAALQQEGIACYKILMRGLLDITDNREGKKIIPPKDVVRLDSDDPYLVVAADKGTASFSDIANGMAAEYGFWLGDAFASGGSAGYDHKKIGITARGAWESVKRHFRELGTDIQTTDFDVVGVGDMGGDVFGNGMLLSRHIRLIGAFNHLHIFCDPNPDTESTFKERERLFRAVKGWDSYDIKKLSKGGRIFNRSDKALALSPEIKRAFGIEKDSIPPQELINAMLKAPVDLLWFGGIGTYIKASVENNTDVGDKANEALRIDAGEIRAKVLGEGANLGVTQKARIEFAASGGRVNADFIDNSGGVNSSDVEVNIKILMSDVLHHKKNNMNMAKRNALLAKMTNEVANLVLRNSYQQAQGISLMALRAPETFMMDVQLIRTLERRGDLKRKIENLPDEAEIARRRAAVPGLTRPELCTLQSYAKIVYTRALLQSDIPAQLEIQDFLIGYFPAPLQEKYKKEILEHRLGHEIIATGIANMVVNRMGPTFIESRMEATGADCATVVRAFLVVREAFGLRHLWDGLEALDGKVPAQVQLDSMLAIQATAARATTWLLARHKRALNLAADGAFFREGVALLQKKAESLLPADLRARVDGRYAAARENALPEGIARALSLLPVFDLAFDILQTATERKADIAATAKAYFEIGEYFGIDWLRRSAEGIPANDVWARESRDTLVEVLCRAQGELALRLLKSGPGRTGQAVAGWAAAHAQEAASVTDLLNGFQLSGTLDLPRLMIAAQRLEQLAQSAA